MRIVIDPGHGGHDPGAAGIESRIVLDYGLQLAEVLTARGHVVHMTRKTDVYVGLSQRAVLANNLDADLFISLHCNGAENPNARGYQTFYAKGSVKGKSFARTLQLLLAPIIGGESDYFFDDMSSRTNGPLTVLRKTRMTAVLLELGFVTNKWDAALIQEKAVRDRICMAIADAISVEYRLPEVVREKHDPDMYLRPIKVPRPKDIDMIAQSPDLQFGASDIRPGLTVALRLLRGMRLAGIKWVEPLIAVLDEWLNP